MKGGTSCDTALAKPTMAWAPTLTNWWMPVRPPTVTQSPSSHVAGQRGVVGHGGVVAHHAVVRDVGVGHDPVVVADARDAALSCTRADVEGAELADGVAVADHQLAGLAGVLLVLRHAPSEPNWKIRLSRPMVVWPSITHVRADRGAGADLHVRADHACRARPRPTASSCGLGIDDRRRMDRWSCRHRAQADGAHGAHQLGLAGQFLADARAPLNL